MRTALRQALSLALAALAPAAAAAFFHPKRPAWTSQEVPLVTAQRWGENVLWVDARADADFEKAHIPGAVLLNENAWDDLLPAVLDAAKADRVLVVYCSNLACASSREVARRLREEVGLPHVYVLRGGWEAWLGAEANARSDAQKK